MSQANCDETGGRIYKDRYSLKQKQANLIAIYGSLTQKKIKRGVRSSAGKSFIQSPWWYSVCEWGLYYFMAQSLRKGTICTHATWTKLYLCAAVQYLYLVRVDTRDEGWLPRRIES